MRKTLLATAMLVLAGSAIAKDQIPRRPPPPPPPPIMMQNKAPTLPPMSAPVAGGWRGLYNPASETEEKINELRYAPKPALYRFGNGKTTIYLFGSIHSLSTGLKWRSPFFDKIFKEATEYAFEVYSPTDERADFTDIFDETMPKVFHYNRPKLLDRVPSELREDLNRRTKNSRIGMPRYILNGMPSMFAVNFLFPDRATSSIRTGGRGVEDQLEPEVRRSGKPAFGLETMKDQSVLLWSWDDKEQDDYLVNLLREAKAGWPKKPIAVGPMDEDELRWATGYPISTNSIMRTMFKYPSATNLMLRDRNARWVEKLTERLKRPGKVFVTVGTAHLDGPFSMQSMLAAKGIKVERIQ